MKLGITSPKGLADALPAHGDVMAPEGSWALARGPWRLTWHPVGGARAAARSSLLGGASIPY
jgi:hypothetical protein